ncbi:hypothetical protein [Mycobacterium sp. E802]|uniref:hypothetical protein n=1 Tax=Mycobacterium sp. E802 TaxID=1834152 RepID=UPI000B3094F2|nr:hypothetical protein [Mycobacterium sp. E802]
MKELAPDGIPMAVTCRVLELARQPYYRWLADPINDSELVEAYRANALFDAHRQDPKFGYRYLVDETRDAGQPMVERTAWRTCPHKSLCPYSPRASAARTAKDDRPSTMILSSATSPLMNQISCGGRHHRTPHR